MTPWTINGLVIIDCIVAVFTLGAFALGISIIVKMIRAIRKEKR